MKKVKLNSLTTIILLSGILLGAIIYSHMQLSTEKINPPSLINKSRTYEKITPMYQLLKNEVIHGIESTKKNYTNLSSKRKFITSIKLNSYQDMAYRKVDAVKAKLLFNILNNTKQKNTFNYVMKKADELQLPRELALIPVIESEYKNNAVSSKGAGGLWQLMPGTAKIFGLSRKQRFEMVASTKAALMHFKDLYNEYGNWELAIAAYNAGDGRVNKALHKNPHAKTVQDLNLPRETREYVLAFFQLQKTLKAYDLTLQT